MPKISVIIPVYGVEKYIERCANSLFLQTLDDIEFIFVDDCSPDKSVDIVRKVLSLYPSRISQVKFHRMPHNSGLPTVRKVGIGLATGEYIAHCDSDDWVDVHMYEIMYNHAKSKNIDIVYCDYYKSDGTNSSYIKQPIIEGLMSGPVWNKLVKASIYENEIYYPKENKAEDGALMMQLSYYAQSSSHISQALYYYFFNPQSICHVPSVEACLERHCQECANLNLRLSFLKEKEAEAEYKDDIVAWKFAARKNLLPLVKEKKYYDLWLNTYPEINSCIFSCQKMPLKSKLLYLIVRFRIYSTVQNILHFH